MVDGMAGGGVDIVDTLEDRDGRRGKKTASFMSKCQGSTSSLGCTRKDL
jgi:hypothetical protein